MKHAKCSVENGLFVQPCDSLSSATEYGNPRGKQKGIWFWQMRNMDTHKPSRSYFGTKSGEHVEKGLLFNFCPFCGEKISEPFMGATPSSANQGAGK
jgi:hypothetical protein